MKNNLQQPDKGGNKKGGSKPNQKGMIGYTSWSLEKPLVNLH